MLSTVVCCPWVMVVALGSGWKWKGMEGSRAEQRGRGRRGEERGREGEEPSRMNTEMNKEHWGEGKGRKGKEEEEKKRREDLMGKREGRGWRGKIYLWQIETSVKKRGRKGRAEQWWKSIHFGWIRKYRKLDNAGYWAELNSGTLSPQCHPYQKELLSLGSLSFPWQLLSPWGHTSSPWQLLGLHVFIAITHVDPWTPTHSPFLTSTLAKAITKLYKHQVHHWVPISFPPWHLIARQSVNTPYAQVL